MMVMVVNGGGASRMTIFGSTFGVLLARLITSHGPPRTSKHGLGTLAGPDTSERTATLPQAQWNMPFQNCLGLRNSHISHYCHVAQDPVAVLDMYGRRQRDV